LQYGESHEGGHEHLTEFDCAALDTDKVRARTSSRSFSSRDILLPQYKRDHDDPSAAGGLKGVYTNLDVYVLRGLEGAYTNLDVYVLRTSGPV
jgi:hypothetical protein